MRELTTNEEIKNLIDNNEIIIIYFNGKACQACDVIKNKVSEIIKEFPQVVMGVIDGEKYIKIAAEYNVFTLPLLIIYVDKKESFRISRNFSVLEFKEILNRYYSVLEL